MNTRRILQKITFIVLTLAACSGLVVLLVAAIGKRNHERCRDYVITIKGAEKNLFIDVNDIKKLLRDGAAGELKDEPIAEFNLSRLEQQLKVNPWVQDANLYFDNQDILHISVRESEPVARIFTASSGSFYIDSNGRQMPLSDKKSANVPVFTNFPDKTVLSSKDSVLLNDIRRTALFILNEPFWMSQVEQIDITKERDFEMVPAVGNQIIKLGDGNDIDRKLRRLLIFYQQVLSKTGLNQYNTIDVRYAGQVIGSRIKMSKIDSMQVKKNVETLLLEAKQMQQDTTFKGEDR